MSENMKELYNRTLVCFVWVRNLVSHTERHTLSLFENRVPRRIFGPTLVEVTGDWSRLYTEDHSIFFMFTQCYSGDKIRNEMVGALTRIWEGGGGCTKGTYRVLVGKPEAQRPPGGHRRRLKDNKTDIQEVHRMLLSKLI